jgi:hypothetical protein
MDIEIRILCCVRMEGSYSLAFVVATTRTDYRAPSRERNWKQVWRVSERLWFRSVLISTFFLLIIVTIA